MERINLTKYGFIRSKEDDFSDDGNRFTCYKVGNVRVSKLVSDGIVYINGNRDDYSLDYETYSKLPHFQAVGRLNGVGQSSLTENDLIQLYNDCVAYDNEYNEAYKNVVWPSKEELINARNVILSAKRKQFKEIESMFTVEKFIKLDEYAVRNLKSYMNSLYREAYPTETEEAFLNRLYKQAYSKNYIKNIEYSCQENFYYKECKNYLNK